MDILSARKKAAEQAKAKQAADRPAEEPQTHLRETEPAAAEPGSAVRRDETVPPLPATGTEPGTADDAGAGSAAVCEQPVEMLAFRLGSEEYALPVERVREVTRVWEITSVPNTPPHVIGVTSLRGAVLPVMDLCPRLGVRAGLRDEKSRIIVTDVNEEGTGVIADRITGMVRFLPSELRPVPESLEQGAQLLRGIVRSGDRLIIVLDTDKAMGA